MSGPWSEYATAEPVDAPDAAGPWAEYREVPKPPPSVVAPDRVPQAMEDRLNAGHEARQREGGLLQTIPQGLELIATPEGRTRLWEAVKKYPSKFIDDTINMAKLPGDVESGKINLNTEEGMDQAIGLGMLVAGSRLNKLGQTGKTSGMSVAMGETVSRIDRGPMGEITELPIGTMARSEDFVHASQVVAGEHAPLAVQEKMLKAYEEQGLHPAEMAHDAQTDPVMAQKLLSSDPADMPAGGPRFKLAPVEDSPFAEPGRVHYEIQDAKGETVGNVLATIDGNVATIDNISAAEGVSSLGSRAVRDLIRQFQDEHPEITVLKGERISGARGGLDEPITVEQQLRKAEPPAPPPEGSFEAAQKAILDKISVGESAPKERMTWDKLYTQAVDDLHPIKGVSEDAYVAARLARGQFGKAEHFLEHGTFDFNTYKTNGKPLNEIIAPVAKDLEPFRAYLASKRALEIDANTPRLKNPHGAIVEETGNTAVVRTKNREGTLGLQIKDDAVHVGIASVGKVDRGKGMAVSMYEEAARFAATKGLPLRSDISVSPAAARVYEALKKRGYDVKLEPNARKFDDGHYAAANSRDGYVFEVRPTSDVMGQKSGMNLTAAQRVAAEGDAKFGKMAEELTTYQNNLLRYMKDSGVLSDDAFGAMVEAGKNYVPFYRVFGEESGGAVGKSFGPGNPLKKLKGSERDIVDPLESIIKNTYAYISVAERNAVGIKIIDALKADGAEVVSSKVRPRDPELTAYLKENGVTNPEAIVDFLKTTAQQDGDTIGAFRNGVKEQVKVNDPELVTAFRGLDQQSAGLLTQVIATPAKLLRAGAVLSPDFIVRNVVRDFMTAFVNSKGVFSPIDTFKGAVSAIRKDGDFQDWLKGGGSNSTLVGLDRRYLQESLQKLDSETGLMSRAWNVVTNPLMPLRMVSELAEQATRLGEFKKVAAGDKASIQGAAFASREVTLDFARIGASMRAYNMITAFGNAQIQGLDRIGRAFVDRPTNTMLKVAGGITLPSVLLWFANKDDERVKELPSWQKDMFWIVATKDHLYRIPKPFELGVVFGSGVERILDQTIGNNPEAFDKFSKSVIDIITPSMTPTAIQPMIEQFANRSTFSDRTLIPADQEKHLPEYQYTPYTTELTKALSKIVSAFPGVRGESVGPGAPFGPLARAVSSPILMENYIRSWTGGLGNYALVAADAGLRKAGVLPDPVKPTDTLADIPVVKAFVVRYPSSSAQSIQEFYDQHEVQKKFYDTWAAKAKEGDAEAMQHIQAAGGPMMFLRLDAIKDTLGEHSKLVRDIYKNPTIKPEEKRQLIDTLYYNMIEIGKGGRQMIRDSKAAVAQP